MENTPQFFSLKHRTLESRGLPYVYSILYGVNDYQPMICPVCGVEVNMNRGNPRHDWNIELTVGKKANKYPDILMWPSERIFSERAIECFEQAGFGSLPCFKRTVVKPYPKGLRDVQPPQYFSLDGASMNGVELDNLNYPYLDYRVCPGCEHPKFPKIPYTYLQTTVLPFIFKEGTWNGAPFFTASNFLSNWVFCTDAVIDCVQRNKLINFTFWPIEIGCNQGGDFRHDYSRKCWRKDLDKSLDDFKAQLERNKTLFQSRGLI